MKCVIDIDENVFTRLFDNGTEDYEIANDDLSAIAKAIRNGTPLPKGHGDLKDVSKINYQQGCFVDSTGSPLPIIHKIATIEMIRDWLPTLIEADKEGA